MKSNNLFPTDAALISGGPATVAGPDDWNQIYLRSAFMHPTETDGLDTSHLAGFATGIAWNALALRPNTQGSSLADVARCMMTDMGADDLACDLGLSPAFAARGVEGAARSLPDDGTGPPWPDRPDAAAGTGRQPPGRFFARTMREVEESAMCAHCLRRSVA